MRISNAAPCASVKVNNSSLPSAVSCISEPCCLEAKPGISAPQQCCPLVDLQGSQRHGLHPMDKHLKKEKGNLITPEKCFNLFIVFPGYKEIQDIHEVVVKDLSFS